MTKRAIVIKLESIRYNLGALVEDKDTPKDLRNTATWMIHDVERLLKPYQGVSV